MSTPLCRAGVDEGTPPPRNPVGAERVPFRNANLDIRNNNLDVPNNNNNGGQAPGEPIQAPVRRRRRAVLHTENAEDEWDESVVLHQRDLRSGPNDGLAETRLFKDIVDYQAVKLALCSIFGVAVGWIFLFFPNTSYTLMGIRYIIILLLFSVGIAGVAKRKDISFIRPYRTLEMRIFQTVMAAVIGTATDIFIEQIGPGLRLFYFTVKNRNAFYEELDFVKEHGSFFSFIDGNRWLSINLQLISISFSFLFLVDMICTLWRISAHNPIISRIIKYELSTYIYPILNVFGTTIFVNELSYKMNPAKQSIPFWCFILFLAFLCYGITLRNFLSHPDIPLRRPLGLHGYLYMEIVTIFQISLGMVFHTVCLLIRGVYYGSVPGAYLDAFNKPGVIVGPPLFFDQILKRIPVERWRRQRLFEPSYDLFYGLFFIIFVIRHCKLRLRAVEIKNRIEEMY